IRCRRGSPQTTVMLLAFGEIGGHAMANPLVQLQRYGQSVWYDNIRRGLITSGTLQAMIDQDGLRGITSNPSIFEKAIGGSTDYDAALKTLAGERDQDAKALFEKLAIEDIRMAADL